MKATRALLLPLLLLIVGCAATKQIATELVVQCPEAYNGCPAD